MNPADKDYNRQTAYRGSPYSPEGGRNYEDNAGYREQYNRMLDHFRPDQEPVGNHRGKGPKSYRRKDERILDDLNDRLCDNPYVDATDIEVSVHEGDVVLSGFVEDRDAKRLAESIGESVSGVANVENRLKVRLKGI
jgi:osmotically-inducible protein OsmY